MHAWGKKEYRTCKTLAQLEDRFKHYVTELYVQELNTPRDNRLSDWLKEKSNNMLLIRETKYKDI